MNLNDHWPEVKQTFESCLAASKHCAIASVDAEGNPHITPIGFIFLQDKLTAFYFEQYSNSIPNNIKHNQNVCLMTVNSSSWYWFKSLLSGKFSSSPGIRLYGVMGQRRKALPTEIQRYKNKIHSTRKLKGNKLLWQGLETVRDIQLTSFKPVQYPEMMEGLWQGKQTQK